MLTNIPENWRVPIAGVLILGGFWFISKVLTDSPQVETFEVQTAAVVAPEAEEVADIIDPYQACQQELNAALLTLQNAQSEVNENATAGRAQDWRNWARGEAERQGTSETQILMAAYASITAKLDAEHLTIPQQVGEEAIALDSMPIDRSIGDYRDLEGSRRDIAQALTTQQTAPYETAQTTELRRAAQNFLDTSGCLLGMEVINVD